MKILPEALDHGDKFVRHPVALRAPAWDFYAGQGLTISGEFECALRSVRLGT